MTRALVAALFAIVVVGCATDKGAGNTNPPEREADATPADPAPAPPEAQAPPVEQALKNGVAHDGYYTGGQPDAAALDAAQAAGVKTVISFRAADETPDFDEQAAVEQRGMTFVRIPVAGAGGLTKDNVLAFDQALQAAQGQPYVAHCGSGNRAGAMYALHAFWLGSQDRDAALATGKAHGLTKLEPAVVELLDKKPPQGH